MSPALMANPGYQHLLQQKAGYMYRLVRRRIAPPHTTYHTSLRTRHTLLSQHLIPHHLKKYELVRSG